MTEIEVKPPLEVTGRELWIKRTLGAVAWTVVFHVSMLNVFFTFATADVLHPAKWFTEWSSAVLSARNWLYVVPVFSVVIAQGVVCSRHYFTVQPFHKTRFHLLAKMFQAQNLVVCLLHIFIGISIPWIYTSISPKRYNSFVYETKDGFNVTHHFCEEKLYLILGGMWISLYYFIAAYFKGPKKVSFPIIQERKVPQVIGSLRHNFRKAMNQVMHPNLVFVLLYYLEGGILRNTFCLMFGLSLPVTPLDTFTGLLSFDLLFHLWLFTTIILFSLRVTKIWFRVYLTERYVFPIGSEPCVANSLKLEDALTVKQVPIIYYLAYLDLYLLSQMSPLRRRNIFTLSLPGGHPYIWENLKRECFGTINTFLTELGEVFKEPAPKPIQPPVFVSPQRRLPEQNPQAYFQMTHTDFYYQAVYKFYDNFWASLNDKLVNALNSAMKHLYRLPLISYFFGDLSDIRIQHIVLCGLPTIWAAQTLSLLACYSLIEDKFGVVQNDLADILVLLLKLKSCLDRLMKQAYAKKSFGKPDRVIIRQGNIIKLSVKRCVYRMIVSFGPYINDIQLPREAETQLHSFKMYRE